jgi:GNAT superfamily N-acetyltransferase
MTKSERQLALVFSPKQGREVSRYVVRGFFSVRELPQALSRMLLTGEFRWFVGIPLLLLLVARLDATPWFGPGAESVSFGLNGLAVAWLMVGLVRISRYGPSSGIGCYVIDADGRRGQLVGGLRMRLEPKARCLWIAGLLVDPAWRGVGIGTALVLGALRIALDEAKRAPLVVSVFAPSHPASRAIVTKYLGGMQTLQVSSPPPEQLSRILCDLEAAVERSGALYHWELRAEKACLFSGLAENGGIGRPAATE